MSGYVLRKDRITVSANLEPRGFDRVSINLSEVDVQVHFSTVSFCRPTNTKPKLRSAISGKYYRILKIFGFLKGCSLAGHLPYDRDWFMIG